MIRRALLEAASDAQKAKRSAAEIVERVRENDRRSAARPDRLCRNGGRRDVAAAAKSSAPDSLIAVAVFFGKTRLIDNILISMKEYDFVVIGSGIAGLTLP